MPDRGRAPADRAPGSLPPGASGGSAHGEGPGTPPPSGEGSIAGVDAPGPDRREGTVRGRRAVWFEAGRRGAPTLLLLHGGGADSAEISWRLSMRAFPERRVVAPDLPGYGGTRRFRGPYTIEALADWVADFAEAADVAPGAVAGVSMGGAAAIALTLRHPARVRALVPVAPFGMGGPSPLRRTLFVASRLPLTLALYGAASVSERAVRRAMRNVWADLDRMPPDLVPAIKRAARVQLRTGSFLSFMKAETTWSGFRTDLSQRVGAIACPTLYVHGERDELIPARSSRRAASLTPGAELALIPEAGHLPMRENPEATHGAMRAFLEGLD